MRTVGLLACALVGCGLGVTGLTPNETALETDGGSPTQTIGEDASPIDSAVEEVDAAPAEGFCASLSKPALFCDDFDISPDASTGWDKRSGSVQRTLSEFKSAPGALDAVVSGGTASLLEKSFQVTSSISLELDVRFPSIPSTGVLSPFILRPSNDTGGYLYLYFKADRTYMQVASDEYSKWLTPPTPGVWHHITATVTFDSAKTTFAGTFDGVAFDWSNVPNTAHAWQIAQTVTVLVGANPYQTSGELFIDNVVVNAR